VIGVLHGEKDYKEYGAHCELLCVISDSIPLQDEIARRFMNFIFGCMHCSSSFISSVVRFAFTNMNSPIVRM